MWEKIVLTAPVYTPDEIVHAMGMVPIGVWGGDIELKESKRYFPAFICSISQSILELGMSKMYDGASAILIPDLCDSLKALGENWKYVVSEIPFVPVMYPQNRQTDFGRKYTLKLYQKVVEQLEDICQTELSLDKLKETILIYNEHNKLMREFVIAAAKHQEITAYERSAVFKSAFFILKEEHSELLKQLLDNLSKEEGENLQKTRVVVSGIIADSPNLMEIVERNNFQIVADDIAAQSRQYRTDAPLGENPLESLAEKYCQMDNCSVLYDVKKKRLSLMIDTVKQTNAKGIILFLTKFCDPEEFDYPILKKMCDKENIPLLFVEIDRQIQNYAQVETALETFKDLF